MRQLLCKDLAVVNATRTFGGVLVLILGLVRPALGCNTNADCNDNNPCTNDTCFFGNCSHSPVSNGTSCDDGNPCTLSDSCQSGQCTSGQPSCHQSCVNCNDNNPCTNDTCFFGNCSHSPVSNGTSCDDGNPCTLSDSCQSGQCTSGQPSCAQSCVNCNDNNPCTNDTCFFGNCSHSPVSNGTSCDDGNPCTLSDSCQSGQCTSGQPSCAQSCVNCNDNNPCTNDTCFFGNCSHSPVFNGTSCDDDGNVCTDDTCFQGTCSHTNNSDGTTCNDGVACTQNENCQSGNCLAPAVFTNAAGSPITVGSVPYDTAFGDVNRDGALDLVVPNSASNNVTILIGNGTGGFSPAAGSPIPVGSQPVSVAVGDLYPDGSLDLAVANRSSNNVTVLLGNGAGGFTQPAGSPVPAGSGPYSLAVGDLNGDSKLDLAVVNYASSGTVTILLGDGSGGFNPAAGSPIAVGSLPESIALGDLNEDGKLDLAVANSGSDNITILLGNGLGAFAQPSGSPIAVGTNPTSLAVGNLNGDGVLDLVVVNSPSNFSSGNATILLGSGSGGFNQAAGSPIAVGTAPNSVTVGDLNGDGKLDLASANTGSANVTVLLGNGSGGFTQPAGSPIVSSGAYRVTNGDLNGDGKLDLASTEFINNRIRILLNSTTRASSPAAEVDSGVRLRKSGGASVMTWNLAVCAGSSDVLRGLVGALPVGPGGGDEMCLANGLPPTTLTWTDGDNPAPSAAYWYLVRGHNPPSAGSPGPWGYKVVNGVPTEEVSTTCP